MHNLLPEENTKKIEKEYRLRLLILSLFSLSFLGLSFFLLLIPSAILIRSQENAVLEKKQLLSNSLVSLQSQNLDSLLKETKEKVDSLKAGNGSIPLHSIIEKVLSHSNPDIKIENFTFLPEKEKIRELSISGVASTRESLVSFNNSLEEEKTFSVSLPVSNFAKQRDISFNLTLKIDVK